MTDYRIYKLDEDGHVFQAALIATCRNDDEARASSEQCVSRYALEVWQGTRRVATIPPPT